MQRIPVCVECESCPTSKFRAHPTPGPGATALAVLARCSFLFAPSQWSSLVLSPRILQQKMGRRPGSSRPLFDHSNASLRAGPEAEDLSTMRPKRATWRSSSGSWPRKPRWKQRIGTAGEPRSSGRGPKAAETAPTGSKGTHSESRGSDEAFHGASWVVYIVTRRTNL